MGEGDRIISSVFFSWLNAVRKEFGTLMTGSLLLVLMGLAQGVWQVPIPRWCYLAIGGCFLTWAFYRTWRKQRLVLDDVTLAKKTEVESLRAEKEAEITALSEHITELSRKPYSEDLERCVNQLLDQMTYQGWLLLRHLLMHERVELGRPFMPADIPVEIQNKQMGIAMSSGVVKHDATGQGPLVRTYYVINQQFRLVLERVLYERLERQPQ